MILPLEIINYIGSFCGFVLTNNKIIMRIDNIDKKYNNLFNLIKSRYTKKNYIYVRCYRYRGDFAYKEYINIGTINSVMETIAGYELLYDNIIEKYRFIYSNLAVNRLLNNYDEHKLELLYEGLININYLTKWISNIKVYKVLTNIYSVVAK